MMHIIDTNGEKVYIKDLRSIELSFDKITKTKTSYSFFNGNKRFAVIKRDFFNEKTRSRLDSLAEWKITNGISRSQN